MAFKPYCQICASWHSEAEPCFTMWCDIDNAECFSPDCRGHGCMWNDGRAVPQQWFECGACDGKGYVVHRVTVYEPGCGFPHYDGDERECEKCQGLGGWVDDVEGVSTPEQEGCGHG